MTDGQPKPIIRRIAIIVLGGIFSLSCSSCASRQVIIDKGIIEEMKTSPSFAAWEAHGPELLCLVQMGDRDGIDAAKKILPVALRSDVVTRLNWLALALWERIDFASDFSDCPEDQLALVVAFYERLRPLDWDEERDKLFKGRPDVARHFESP